RLELANKNKIASKDVVLVLVDEASLYSAKKLLGRWPWPRTIWSQVVEFLNAAGARQIVFDILFSEPQIARNEQEELGEDDINLVSSSVNGKVYHAYQLIHDTQDEYKKDLILNQPLPSDFIDKFSLKVQLDNYTPNDNYNNYYLPIPELYQASFGAGVVEFAPDQDGIFRQTKLLRSYQGKFYPTLSMAPIIDKLDIKNIKLSPRTLFLENLPIQLNNNGQYYINMKKNFTTISAGGLLATIQSINQGNMEGMIVTPEEFKDKIVFLAGSAVGIEDLKATALGQLPGVYLHASIIDNILNESFINQIELTSILPYFLLASIIVTLFTIGGANPFVQNISFPLISAGYLYFATFVFKNDYTWYPIITPLLALLLLPYVLSLIFVMMTEGKEKRFLKAAFSNYISPELIDQMHQSGEPPKLGGDVGLRTAYFTDIQGFSSFSEKLSAPRLVELLNEYLTDMTDILLAEGGTLDKYEGDAIIAFFGAPMPMEDHAVRACRVAHKMQVRLGELRNKWTKEGDKWPAIVHNMRMRIGINSGEIVTGNMGSKKRMNYTMMGDAVNLSARLEASAKQYGVFTQIAQDTVKLTGDNFEFRQLDTIRVVGKTLPVTTYELLGMKGEVDDNLKNLKAFFENGLAEYKQQKWDKALDFFKKSLECEHRRYPELVAKDNPSTIYIERCDQFKQTPPPPDWDGVFTLTSK
ncbi:MAG: hypothetical protein A2451_07930, partial [Bdellovibrionales bacterium RIFOXYC2_FULL_39_8]